RCRVSERSNVIGHYRPRPVGRRLLRPLLIAMPCSAMLVSIFRILSFPLSSTTPSISKTAL
ncbi:MAG: hypothetical protein II305_07625, partial [Clostridia bacterium]|nr:hypothetical protein [Clostridia bacterium]